MKKILVLGILFFSFSATFAQEKVERKLAKANTSYDRLQYADALKEYQTALKKDTNSVFIKEKIANCYQKMNEPKDAENWYAQVVSDPKSDVKSKLYYAESLASNGKHSQAKTWYDAYAREAKEDGRPKGFSEAYSNMPSFYKDSTQYQIKIAPFNSDQDDFSPSYNLTQKDETKLIFVSNRHKAGGNKFEWNNTSYLDLYSVADAKTTPTALQKYSKKLNSKYHEGPIAFFPSGDSVLFTRNNYTKNKYKTSEEGVNKLKLYIATKDKNGILSNEREFPYNSSEYSVGAPALAPDGKTLYFISDPKDKAIGGKDIFMSVCENGKWSEPQNLGKEINTLGDEMFPYVDARGNLFFSSTGHSGLGGLDLFMCENVDGKFMKPVNLGYPMNTPKDDFGMIVATDGLSGYLSSNREGGVGRDDIYEFISKKPFTSYIMLAAITVHAVTKQPIPGASVLIKMTEEPDAPKATNENGMVPHKFNRNFKYTMIVKKVGFEDKIFEITPEELAKFKENDLIEIPLTPVKVVEVVQDTPVVIILDEETREPVASHLIVTDKTKKDIIDENDINTKYLKNISNGKYDLKVSAKGYFFKNDTMNIANSKKKLQKIVLLKRLKKNAILTINSITFEFNSDKLTPASVAEVAYVNRLMQENPSLKIGVWAHTDAVGTDERNLNLSERRAKSVYSVIVSQGVPMERMEHKGFGEGKPVATNNTKEGRAQNRRVEFQILDYVSDGTLEIKDKFDKDKKFEDKTFDEKKALEEEKKKIEKEKKEKLNKKP